MPTDVELDAWKAEGRSMVESGRTDDAQETLKRYLRLRPLDAEAHYFLGRTYILSGDSRPILAEGEYQTALRLFEAREGGNEEFPFPEDRFRLMCALESAKAMYVYAGTLNAYKVPRQYLQEAVRKGDAYLTIAERISRTDPEVRHVRQRLNALAQSLGVPLDSQATPA